MRNAARLAILLWALVSVGILAGVSRADCPGVDQTSRLSGYWYLHEFFDGSGNDLTVELHIVSVPVDGTRVEYWDGRWISVRAELLDEPLVVPASKVRYTYGASVNLRYEYAGCEEDLQPVND